MQRTCGAQIKLSNIIEVIYFIKQPTILCIVTQRLHKLLTFLLNIYIQIPFKTVCILYGILFYILFKSVSQDNKGAVCILLG